MFSLNMSLVEFISHLSDKHYELPTFYEALLQVNKV